MEVDLRPHLAAATERSQLLQALLDEKPGHEITRFDFNGKQLVHHAASAGDVAALELLLSRGASVDVVSIPAGVTPLSLAIEGGHFDLARAMSTRSTG
jgi:ankyrin repeat protein